MSVAAREARLRDPALTRHHAFGIEVQATLPLPLARGTPGNRRRATVLETRSAQELERVWRPGRGVRVLERRRRDGQLVMSVDHDQSLGYRVVAPRNGRHLVSPDGTRILSALPNVAPWRWQRLLFAQVLPLAATLQGLELLHASAVALDRRALGFVAASGTGKTSVAAHLVESGAALLTDDVLALELVGGTVVAHPGVGTLSLSAAELARMSPAGRDRLGVPLGRADKIVLAPDVVGTPTELGSLYFLERPTSGTLRIEPLAPDPLRLFANSFNSYVRTPERIVNQLAIAARAVEAVPLFSVGIPSGTAASQVALAILEHAERT